MAKERAWCHATTPCRAFFFFPLCCDIRTYGRTNAVKPVGSDCRHCSLIFFDSSRHPFFVLPLLALSKSVYFCSFLFAAKSGCTTTCWPDHCTRPLTLTLPFAVIRGYEYKGAHVILMCGRTRAVKVQHWCLLPYPRYQVLEMSTFAPAQHYDRTHTINSTIILMVFFFCHDSKNVSVRMLPFIFSILVAWDQIAAQNISPFQAENPTPSVPLRYCSFGTRGSADACIWYWRTLFFLSHLTVWWVVYGWNIRIKKKDNGNGRSRKQPTSGNGQSVFCFPLVYK